MDVQQSLDTALEAAGTSEADAVVMVADGNISRFANSNVHQNMSEVSTSLSIRVIVDGKIGVASSSSLQSEDIAETAAVAREAARFASRLERFPGLYRGGEPAPALPLSDEATLRITPMEKAESLRSSFDEARRHGVQLAGTFGTSMTTVACGNTHGVRRFAEITAADASVIAMRGDDSGFAAACSRRIGDVTIEALAARALDKCKLAADRRQTLPAGDYDVVLEPAALVEIFEWLNMIAFSGQSFDDGSSFFVGNLGRKLMGANVTIEDDALDPALLPFPFDMEGLPKRRVTLIDRGVVITPVVDTLYASRLGFEPTANAWDLGSPEHGTAFHISMAPGESEFEELIAGIDRGVLVTRFNYVNGLLEPKTALMTGTTRDGTFLIEKGVVVARLPNLRWTQSILAAFSHIDGLTRTRARMTAWYNTFGATLVPAVRIRGWHFDGEATVDHP